MAIEDSMTIMLDAPVLDKDGMFRNLRREGTPSRVFMFEHAVDDVVQDAICSRFDLAYGLTATGFEQIWQRRIRLFRFLGHELFRVKLAGTVFALYADKWVNQTQGPIRSQEDIARYPWPELSKVDFSELDWYERNLPEDMGVYHSVHVFETVRDLMGFEAMCVALYERPEFVDEICDKVSSFAFGLTKALCQYRCVSAVYGCDDFGFKTSLLLDPINIRKRFLSRHREFAQHAHEYGKFYFMHSCGQLAEIMDDIIDDVKADAKQSFEDVITPVTEAKKLWGDRITMLGGLDVDFIARSDEAAIRKRVRETLVICMPGGGYCLGMGNWVTSYIPPENYLVILDEARRYC